MKRLLAVLLTVGLISTAAVAHNGMEHVMGTVASVSDTSITVTATDGKSQTVAVTANTKYAKGSTTIILKDIKVGDHVVIHATEKNEKLTAATVKVGTVKMAAMPRMKMDDHASPEHQQ